MKKMNRSLFFFFVLLFVRDEVNAVDAKAEARLPTNLLPISYKIQLLPVVEVGNFTTAGEVWINLNCTSETKVITFNINDIVIDESKIVLVDVTLNQEVRVVSTAQNEDLQFYYVYTSITLIHGHEYRLHLSFVGQLNDLLQGFYRSSYVDSASNETRWLASTQFSPTDARRAFPCLDEPAFKATFEIMIARKSSMHTLSNMPLNQTFPVDGMDGWVWDLYPPTLRMSTYLVAFVVSDLEYINANNNQTANPLEFKAWARRDALPNSQYALSVGPQMLAFLENYFDIPFPLPKQDIVAIPDFGFNAMENWGLITFRESAMLFYANLSTEENKQETAYVMGHELGHQWFGNLVTPQWWNDLWLKEGFATFTGSLAAEYVEPTWKMKEQLVTTNMHSVLKLDALESSHPISVTVDHPDEIRQIFDKISYDKGASLIRMMNHFLGEATFKAGLTSYLDALKFSNARQEDLWQFLTDQAHADNALPASVSVELIMDPWTLQSGYPVVSVTRDYSSQNITAIAQERYIWSGKDSVDETVTNVTWWVPISWTSKSLSDFETTKPQLWLENLQSTTIGDRFSNSDWVLFNIQEAGYFRVNYDAENWNLLAEDFLALPELTRAQLIDDSLNLAAGGYLEYDIALSLTQRMTEDVAFLPWRSTFSNTAYLQQMLAQTNAYDSYTRFMLEVSAKVYETLGFEESSSDNHLDVLNRANVLSASCSYGSPECVSRSQQKFADWMNSDVNMISPNQKNFVYCTAIKLGGNAEWDWAWRKYLVTNIVSEKVQILDALGCSRDQQILERYLNMTLLESSGIRKQDGSRAFASVASNVDGYTLAFNFLRSRWDDLQNYYGLAFSSISKMVSSIGTYMKTSAELSQLEQFYEDNSNQLGTTGRSFNQTIEKVRANVRWMERNYASVEEWLLNHLAQGTKSY